MAAAGNEAIPAKAFPAKGKDHRAINSKLGLPDDKPTQALFELVNGVLKK